MSRICLFLEHKMCFSIGIFLRSPPSGFSLDKPPLPPFGRDITNVPANPPETGKPRPKVFDLPTTNLIEAVNSLTKFT